MVVALLAVYFLFGLSCLYALLRTAGRSEALLDAFRHERHALQPQRVVKRRNPVPGPRDRG